METVSNAAESARVCGIYLNEIVEDSFASHVAVDSVVSTQEVWSEMLQQRVEVQRVITALLTTVDALATLTHTNSIY